MLLITNLERCVTSVELLKATQTNSACRDRAAFTTDSVHIFIFN